MVSKRLGSVTGEGDLECPDCMTDIITPHGRNPSNGRDEKMTLVAGGSCICALCGLVFTVTTEEARKHNAFWFPEDPEFKGDD